MSCEGLQQGPIGLAREAVTGSFSSGASIMISGWSS